MDIEKKKQKVFHSRDGGGVGCIAVHGDNDYIAIGEKGDWPNIYIYDFPDLNLYRILKKGAEKSYSNIVFSIDGNTMASVGNNPDYLLIIWDWRKQQMMLKAKAFS
jgi:WD40 repeat protein